MSARDAARRRIGAVLLSLAVLASMVRFGLPALLHGLGLHPQPEPRAFELAGRRALIVATNQDVLGDTGRPTGVASSELTYLKLVRLPIPPPGHRSRLGPGAGWKVAQFTGGPLDCQRIPAEAGEEPPARAGT